MRVLVSPEKAPAYETDLFDFVEKHELPPDEIADMVGSLHGCGEYVLTSRNTGWITIEKVRQ